MKKEEEEELNLDRCFLFAMPINSYFDEKYSKL